MPSMGNRAGLQAILHGTRPDDVWTVSSVKVAAALGSRLEELVLHQHLKEELEGMQQAKKQVRGRCFQLTKKQRKEAWRRYLHFPLICRLLKHTSLGCSVEF